MLTIFAWMVFVPAVIWNMIVLTIAFTDIVGDRKYSWNTAANWRDLTLGLAILFIPGIYLFGVF